MDLVDFKFLETNWTVGYCGLADQSWGCWDVEDLASYDGSSQLEIRCCVFVFYHYFTVSQHQFALQVRNSTNTVLCRFVEDTTLAFQTENKWTINIHIILLIFNSRWIKSDDIVGIWQFKQNEQGVTLRVDIGAKIDVIGIVFVL